MAWNNLSLQKKFGIVFGTLIVLALLTAFLTHRGLSRVVLEKDRLLDIEAAGDDLVEQRALHSTLIAGMYATLAGHDMKSTSEEKAGGECGLTAWFQSDDRKTIETYLPGLAGQIQALEEAHKAFHAGRNKFDQIIKAGGEETSEDLASQGHAVIQTEILEAFSRMEAAMNIMDGEIHEEAKRVSEALNGSVGMLKITISVLSILAVLFTFGAGFVLTRTVLFRIRHLISFSEKVSTGDLTAEIPVDHNDEFGELAQSLKAMSGKLGSMFSHIVADIVSLSSSSNLLFSVSNTLAEGAGGMSERSFTVAAAAEEMSSNMHTVAAASEESSTSITMVAAATEEMTSSVNAIALELEKARTITVEAVTKARGASERVSDLGQAAADIDKVTEVITEISEQTNLLALNATIEAARAGEAGKGFAVVANEIKELARQTAQATQDIKDKIQGIQDTTTGTSQEIIEISKVIHHVNDIVTFIASSVDEQAKATAEIAGNVSQASLGIQEVNINVAQCSLVAGEIAKDISQVSHVANDFKTGSRHVSDSAGDLSTFASKIRNMVASFKLPESEEDSRDDGQNIVVSDLITFDSRIMLGIDTIDNQHRKLVDLINRLHKSMKLRQSRSISAGILDELVEYTVTHFTFEENLMKKLGYSESEDHFQKHKELVSKVNDFRNRFSQGNATLSMDLMDFLKEWLVVHIHVTDRSYVEFFKSRGVA